MSMNLDKRQRAMLREMGIRVWQPLPERAAAPEATVLLDQNAIEIVAEKVQGTSTKPEFDVKNAPGTAAEPSAGRPPEQAAPAAAKTAPQHTAPAVVPASSSTHTPQAESASCWGMAPAQQPYPATGADTEAAKTGARWLVLAEVPSAALQQALASPSGRFDAFEGDAGRLLDNMLRAARIPSARSVHLVAIARGIRPLVDASLPSGSASEAVSLTSDLAAALPALMAAAQPDLVLVMGRFAGQALLQTDQPFGKLRGQTHSLHGKPVIVTYDATYLLRQQLEKAKAWHDLRMAMAIAAAATG